MAGLFGPGHPWFSWRRGRSKISGAALGAPMDGRDKKEPGHDGPKKGGSIRSTSAQPAGPLD
jgi:hypothetical protein